MKNKIKSLFERFRNRRKINKYVQELERQEKILKGHREYYPPSPIHFEDSVPPTLIHKLLGLIARKEQEIKPETKWHPMRKTPSKKK